MAIQINPSNFSKSDWEIVIEHIDDRKYIHLHYCDCCNIPFIAIEDTSFRTCRTCENIACFNEDCQTKLFGENKTKCLCCKLEITSSQNSGEVSSIDPSRFSKSDWMIIIEYVDDRKYIHLHYCDYCNIPFIAEEDSAFIICDECEKTACLNHECKQELFSGASPRCKTCDKTHRQSCRC
jgi:hypothetical protein